MIHNSQGMEPVLGLQFLVDYQDIFTCSTLHPFKLVPLVNQNSTTITSILSDNFFIIPTPKTHLLASFTEMLYLLTIMLYSTQPRTKSCNFQKVGGTGEHYVKQNKPDSERQIMRDL